MTRWLEGLARAAVRRPLAAVAIMVALAMGGGALALTLRPSTGLDTFVSRSADSFQATDQDHRHFGGDAVVILVREPLSNLVLSKDLATITFLESCLAGQYAVPSAQLGSFTPAPAGTRTPYGGPSSPCGKLMKARPVQVVYGPGTFLNQAVAAVNVGIRDMLLFAKQQIDAAGQAAQQLAIGRGLTRAQATRAANAARTLASQQQAQGLQRLALNSGITSAPRIDDKNFISQVVFDQTRGVNQPKSRLSYLFPTASAALIQVRLKASLSGAQQSQAIDWIRQAVRMPMFRSAFGATTTVSGAPVVLDDLAARITGSIVVLLIAAVLVMGAVLLVVFHRRLRLLPLLIALGAVGISFGAMTVVGGTLTMATIAVLPILIGLAVDYAIQFQSRVLEFHGRQRELREAVFAAAAAGAPAIAVAALATATGFLVLLLSPVPMVRDFGLLLVVGIVVAFLCAVAAVSAALVLADRGGGALGASIRGAGEILAGVSSSPRRRIDRGRKLPGDPRGLATDGGGLPGRLLDRVRALPALAARHPGRVLALGAVLALVGWVTDTQTSVQSDVTKLVPSDMPALRDLRTLERVTGVSGQIDVLVQGRDVATPAVVGWMLDYQSRLQRHFGYLESNGCQASTLCPALSLPALFASGSTSGQSTAPTQAQITALLASVPSYFSGAVITPSHRAATLAFGIRLMPLSRQASVISYMRSQLHPPAGVTARLAGIPVLAADADAALSSSVRRLLTLVVGLLAVALVLFAALRSGRRALVPIIPIVLATGWSALILFIIGIPLNPMSATLGALVIAISTEFSVLLSERFRQERVGGASPAAALELTLRSTGRAALASGVTAIAGFGVLILSPITMLRDFGFVTVIDLSVSLVGVLVVLPAILTLAERDDLRALGAEWFSSIGFVLPRGRGRPSVT